MDVLEDDYRTLIERVRPEGWTSVRNPVHTFAVTTFKFPADAESFRERLRSHYHLPVDMWTCDELPVPRA